MGIGIECVNHDDMLSNANYDPLMVSELDTSTPEKLEEFKRHLYTHYVGSDTIEESAACDCKHIREVQLIGVVCPNCNTKVVSSNERPIVPSMWIEAPAGVRSLISPHLWIMLDEYTTTKEFSFIRYLMDTKYKTNIDRLGSKETKRKVNKLLARGFERGLNYFIDHFDEIFEFFLTSNIIDKNKSEISRFVSENKKNLFPKSLPIPSKVCMVVESTTSGTYIDKPILLAVDAALSMASLNSDKFRFKPQEIQNITAQAIANLSTFHQIYAKDRLARKPGILRRSVISGSLYFTGRNVITSVSKPHNYEQLELPWGMALQLFKYHIMSVLYRRGYTVGDAMAMVYRNVLNDVPNPIVAEILDTMIANTNGGKGPACLLNRNPTLQRGSIQFFYIGLIKKDTGDNTIGIPVGCLRAPNADFDGDQLNLTLITDDYLTNAAMRFAPHLWVWSLDEPHTISGNLETQGPVIETGANWISRARHAAKEKRLKG